MGQTRDNLTLDNVGNAYLAGGIRNAVNVPVISSNRITDPGTAERILAEGNCVTLGQHVADLRAAGNLEIRSLARA